MGLESIVLPRRSARGSKYEMDSVGVLRRNLAERNGAESLFLLQINGDLNLYSEQRLYPFREVYEIL